MKCVSQKIKDIKTKYFSKKKSSKYEKYFIADQMFKDSVGGERLVVSLGTKSCLTFSFFVRRKYPQNKSKTLSLLLFCFVYF